MGHYETHSTNNDYALLEDISDFVHLPPPTIAYEVTDFSFKVRLIGEGVGMSLLPECCLEDAKKIVPDLQIFSIDNYALSRTVLIAKRSTGTATPLAEDFWKFALDFYK